MDFTVIKPGDKVKVFVVLGAEDFILNSVKGVYFNLKDAVEQGLGLEYNPSKADCDHYQTYNRVIIESNLKA